MPSTPTTPEPRAQASQELARLVGTKLGNYRLERLIGRGRMGAVYLAKDEALLRPTAVKVLAWASEEARGQDPVQWFLAEARLVARINDPRVVQIYGAARQGDYCYIAMEYVPGQSTEVMLAERGRLDPRLATDVVLQTASALLAAHRSGVVHRDVKPANLLVGPGGVTKLGDFGMAFGAVGVGVGNAHVRAGTPFYTAPEIWRGATASPASDLYALGATYYHLLTGRPPFEGADVATVERAHLESAVPDPRALVPGLPAACAALVRRALAKAPGERHPSAQELMREGLRVLQELGGEAPAGGSVGLPPAPAPATAHSGLGRRARPGDPPRAPEPPRLAREPAPLPPPGALSGFLGFARRPFGPVDPAAPSYLGEPLAAAATRLRRALQDPETSLLLVTGGPGSGRSTLVRAAAAEAEAGRLVVALDLDGRDPRPLLARLCAAAGVADPGPDAMGTLLQRLDEERQRQRPVPLLVLDGAALDPAASASVARLMSTASTTRMFRLLVAGAPALVGARGAADLKARRAVEVTLPPLDAAQAAAYVRARLGAARAARAVPLVFSPDALLLLVRRAGGSLGRLDLLAENMLVLAGSERRRAVTSWHALAASDQQPWLASGPPAGLAQPAGWPTPQAAAAIAEARREAGLPPWPRDPGRAAP